jgi:hypothetical protein
MMLDIGSEAVVVSAPAKNGDVQVKVGPLAATHADVCRRMLTYAGVCRRKMTYADICVDRWALSL